MLETSPDVDGGQVDEALNHPVRSALIGPRLRHYRERAGLRQSEVARRTGVDEAQISRWECPTSTRYQPVPAHRLPQLAAVLDVSLDELAPEAMDDTPSNVIRSARFGQDRTLETPERDTEDDLVSWHDADFQTPRTETFTTDTGLSGPRPMAGRPRPADDGSSTVVFRLRCPWCGVVNESRPVTVAETYTADPLPFTCDQRDDDGQMLGCGQPMRARVTVSARRTRL